MVKVICHRSKEERNFLLNEVDVDDISTIKDLKFFCERKLPAKNVAHVGYIMKGRIKICLQTDKELSEYIHSKLCRGKSSLWLEGIMPSSSEQLVQDETEASPPRITRKKYTVTRLWMKNVSVFSVFLRSLKKNMTQHTLLHSIVYGLRRLNPGGHDSKEEPPRGTIFKVKSQASVHSSSSQAQVTCSTEASLNTTPLKNSTTASTGSASLTPKSAASLKSTYIQQIKDLHELLQIEAIDEKDYRGIRDQIIHKMNNL